eukprot:scaffold233463_cov46-Tisochrysis_lutea.AAC.2
MPNLSAQSRCSVSSGVGRQNRWQPNQASKHGIAAQGLGSKHRLGILQSMRGEIGCALAQGCAHVPCHK